MTSSKLQRSQSAFVLLNEIQAHSMIAKILAKRFDEKSIAKAQRIFDAATEQHIWKEIDWSRALSMSYGSWEVATKDYKGDAHKLILGASVKLYQSKLPQQDLGCLDIRKIDPRTGKEIDNQN